MVSFVEYVLARPTPELLTCAERVLCYLYRTRQIGLCYIADQKPLAGMSDSNWATKHSTSGWVFRFCSAAVSWGSKKQKSVALSSCEAEIVASSEAGKQPRRWVVRWVDDVMGGGWGAGWWGGRVGLRWL